MTVLSRGARARRGGRRPGWLLLTVLLVLAIAASSALVFTNRVELLKLAVILALWAAVVAAFVSVIYRRQSDADQAKVRDLKLVYDLQLDREISARREYELTVETHLRREIAAELRAQSADEVAALRAELAALRTNLEILFDADLAHRPAIETDEAAGEWIRSSQPVRSDRVVSSRVTEVDDDMTRTAESPIIDVPEEPLAPPSPPAPEPTSERRRRRRAEEDDSRGSHRRPSEATGWAPQAAPVPPPPPPQPPPQQPPPPQPHLRPEPQPHLRPEPQPYVRPEPQPQWQPVGSWMPGPPPPATPAAHTGQLADPPATPTGPPSGPAVVHPTTAANGHSRESALPPTPPPVTGQRRGRHSGPSEPEPAWSVPSRPVEPEPERRGRHSVPAPPAAAMPTSEPAARHRGSDSDSPSSGGLSAAELLARFQAESSGGGGRRRRRED